MTKTGKPSPQSTTPKAFDVFRPGRTKASPTSRPVIVGHNKSVQDSTVTDKPPTQIVGEPRYNHIMDSHDKVEVATPTDEEHATYTFVSDDANETTMPEKDAQTHGEKPDEPGRLPEPSQAEANRGTHKQAEVNEAATEAGELAITHDAVVAFHKPSKGRQAFKIFGIVVAAVVVCVALFDVLLDAGVVKPTTNIPHTHFFNK